MIAKCIKQLVWQSREGATTGGKGYAFCSSPGSALSAPSGRCLPLIPFPLPSWPLRHCSSASLTELYLACFPAYMRRGFINSLYGMLAETTRLVPPPWGGVPKIPLPPPPHSHIWHYVARFTLSHTHAHIPCALRGLPLPTPQDGDILG